MELESNSVVCNGCWDWAEFSVKDKEAEGVWNGPLLGGRQVLTLVGCSPTLRTAGLAVCFMLLLPVPGG